MITIMGAERKTVNQVPVSSECEKVIRGLIKEQKQSGAVSYSYKSGKKGFCRMWKNSHAEGATRRMLTQSASM